MKRIFASRKHHCVTGVGTLLVAVALVAGMAGCNTEPSSQHDLSVFSTEGGSVTAPGEDTFAYNHTTVVNLVAEADLGYQFVRWTGDVGTVKDVNAVATNITMNATYSITAIFAVGIWDWNDLDAARNNPGGIYILMSDLDSTTADYEELASSTANEGWGWQPIGTEDQPFTGGLYGQGHKIRDLFIDRPEGQDVGLFGFVGPGGVIENIGLVNATVIGYERVGGLVARNSEGAVSNSYSAGPSGSVKGYIRVGGLVGWNQGTVSQSYSAVRVGDARSVGGLVGYNTGVVSDSYSSGSVRGFEYTGGLIGTNHVGGAVIDCYSSTAVTCEVPPLGGLVGVNYVSLGCVQGVRDSFWDIQTSELDTSAGGTGKNTAELKAMDTFSAAGWSITAVASPDTRDPSSIWNIVDGQTYPFLGWQPVS
jgi:hypothetical protein